jgi:hypothetical protein
MIFGFFLFLVDSNIDNHSCYYRFIIYTIEYLTMYDFTENHKKYIII